MIDWLCLLCAWVVVLVAHRSCISHHSLLLRVDQNGHVFDLEI